MISPWLANQIEPYLGSSELGKAGVEDKAVYPCGEE